jgi:DnaK suppressor protein
MAPRSFSQAGGKLFPEFADGRWQFLDHENGQPNNPPPLGRSSNLSNRISLTSRDSAKMKPDELSEFRTMLKLLQARLRGDVEQLQEEAFAGSEAGNESRSSNHMAEMGSDAWDLDFSLQLVESDQGVLEEISHALKKVDAGSYGLCEACLDLGKAEAKARIPKARLQAIPHARNCIECERIKENRR